MIRLCGKTESRVLKSVYFDCCIVVTSADKVA